MCSAAAIVLPVGALTTVIPARVAASRSTLSTPTPARPMTISRVPAAIRSASTLTWLRTTSASYSGRIAAISSAGSPSCSSTSWWARSSSSPCDARGSTTRTLMPGPPRACRRPMIARCAAATAAPGRTSSPCSIATSSRTPIAARMSSPVTDPRWPTRKILPLSLPWPPASTRPRARAAALNAFQSSPSGIVAAVTVRDATSSAPAARTRAPGGRPGSPRRTLVAREHAVALGLHQPEPLVDLVQDGDRGRPRGLAIGWRSHGGAAGRGRSGASGPSRPRPTPAGRRRPSPCPGAAIQAFWDPVTTRSRPQPSIVERDGAQGRDRVDEEQRVRGDVADRRGERGDVVGHARSRSRCGSAAPP